jgi:hypothetical protein
VDGHILVRLTRAPFDSIAMIRGRAAGNGSELALACDMSFMSREKAVPFRKRRQPAAEHRNGSRLGGLYGFDRPPGRPGENQELIRAGLETLKIAWASTWVPWPLGIIRAARQVLTSPLAP